MTTETLTPETTFVQKTLSQCSGKLPELLALGGYVALLTYAIPRHEPWADEAQAWQLARSLSVPELFRHYLRYEGSPGLWHLWLAGLSSIHVSYGGMHWATGIIATIGIALLIFLSPFPRYIKLSLPFTFFLAFQYVVVARSYSLVPVLLFAIAASWRRRPLLVALLLGLLANVAMHAFAISGGMAILYLIDQGRRQNRKQLLYAAALLVGLYCMAFATVFPKPHDLSFKTWPSQFPQTLKFRLITWLPRSIYALLVAAGRPFFLTWLIWVVFIWQFVRAGKTAFLIPILTFTIFAGYYAMFWHDGLVVPTGIAICWIAWDSLAPTKLFSGAVLSGAAWIALQIAWSVHAFSYDATKPYSPDLEASRFLAPYVAAHESIAVSAFRYDAFHSIGLSPYFEQPIFINQQSPFWVWSKDANTQDEFLRTLQQHPKLVDVMLVDDRYAIDSEGEDPSKFPLTVLLQRNGYRITHTFCAWRPEGLREREDLCHVIFEQESTIH